MLTKGQLPNIVREFRFLFSSKGYFPLTGYMANKADSTPWSCAQLYGAALVLLEISFRSVGEETFYSMQNIFKTPPAPR